MLRMSTREKFTAPPAWDCEEDDRLLCRAVYRETHDVMTFVFSAPEPRQFHFMPGQFLTFEFVINGEPVHRSYTIASSPTRPHTVAITTKRKEGGLVSNWLHDNLRAGDVVRAVGPLGEFSTEEHECNHRLFLSGGVGVTPFMSIARHDFDLGEDLDTVFMHFARTPNDVMFKAELDLMAKRRANLRIAHVVDTLLGDTGWSGLRGRVTRASIEVVAPDFRDREIFCCGPEPFMQTVRQILKEADYNFDWYHEESFDFGKLSPEEQEAAPEPETPQDAVRTHSVTFRKSGRVVECDENTNILAAARAAGMRLPSSCTKGLCGTCKTGKVSGEVEMTHSGGIRQREIDQGKILICCSRPRGDVVLDR